MLMNEFGVKVRELVGEKLNEEYIILKNSIVKANDIVKNAITVQRRGENIAKNIYLEEYYQMYKKGYSMDKIIEDVLRKVMSDNSFIMTNASKELLKNMGDYEAVKNRIIIKLLNEDMNKRYLEDKFYITYKDLVIVFCIVWNEIGDGMATSCVSKALFECWNVSEEQVYNQAVKNTQSLFQAKIEDMRSVLLELYGSVNDLLGDEAYIPDDDNGKYFYVLSNEPRLNGAAAMMYDDILKNFADEQEVDEVIIIPSSIHEVILIPKPENSDISEKKCYEMVNEVNSTSVEPEEILSNNIYIYSRIADEVTIWNE